MVEQRRRAVGRSRWRDRFWVRARWESSGRRRSLCLGDVRECAFRVRDGVHVRTGQRAFERGVVDVKVQLGLIRRALRGACSRVSYLSRSGTFQGLAGVTSSGIWMNHPVNVRESL